MMRPARLALLQEVDVPHDPFAKPMSGQFCWISPPARDKAKVYAQAQA